MVPPCYHLRLVVSWGFKQGFYSLCIRPSVSSIDTRFWRPQKVVVWVDRQRSWSCGANDTVTENLYHFHHILRSTKTMQEVWPTRDAQPRIVGGLQPEQSHAVELKRKRQKPEQEELWRMSTTRRPMLARSKQQEQMELRMREALVMKVERRIVWTIARELALLKAGGTPVEMVMQMQEPSPHHPNMVDYQVGSPFKVSKYSVGLSNYYSSS